MPVLFHDKLSGFRAAVDKHVIADEIENSGYVGQCGQLPSIEEKGAWNNSLTALKGALDGLDDDLDVYVEYVIPPENPDRVDFMITGFDTSGKKTVVMIELKQWSAGSIILQDDQPVDTVHARWDNCDKEHPALQVCRYSRLLYNHCTSVRDKLVTIYKCVYLHNYYRSAGIVDDPRFNKIVDNAPLFFMGEGEELAKFISEKIISPDFGQTVMALEDPENLVLDPRLEDAVLDILAGGRAFTLNNEKEPIFLKVKDLYVPRKKTIVVISGAPGTGKTVLALRLMGEFRRKKIKTRYVTLSQNLRYLFIDKIVSGAQDKEQYREIREGAEALISSPYFPLNAMFRDISIVDEAHRLPKMLPDRYNPKHYDNRAEYIIENSTMSVFLIDDDQQVRWEDYCTVKTICDYAKRKDYKLITYELKDGIRQYTPYIDWVTALFTKNPIPFIMNPTKYLVKVIDKASELYAEILRLNDQGFRARMLAGYCWEWKTRGRRKNVVPPEKRDIIIRDRNGNVDLQLMWNLSLIRNDYGGTWIGRTDSVDEVGCIHTAQGMDLDYAGIIIGRDITYNKSEGRIEFHVEEHPRDDSSVTVDMRANRKVDGITAERLIRNAYRVLMTRGTKGCLIFCEDENLADYIKGTIRDHKR